MGTSLDQQWMPSQQPTAKVPMLAQCCAKVCLVYGCLLLSAFKTIIYSIA